ncbi:Signal transduction histidine kinase [Sphingomonas gellani]|uniref:histidine kinase n=1 Tax=Sphingomonas gellani TaxID=1166340 RepID=A0A1H8ETK0_9SPHN|nr:ATP-binding protein [Sphingomonas gellani]SEN22706.1 Signal transduction histidine kinase [Sphingomonas gellani]
MAVLIAIALFVAQAVNFGLILRERARFRVDQATRPVATRIADALEREARDGRILAPDRGRVRRVDANPIGIGYQRFPNIADELGRQLDEVGVRHLRIDTGLVPPSEQGRWADRRAHRDPDDRPADMLMLAVQEQGGRWLLVRLPWPGVGPHLLLALATQTLILYGIILLPVLWIARRLSRPLRDLTLAAGRFDPQRPAEDVAEGGPEDLRQLVVAFNLLQGRVRAMLDEKDRMLGAIGHDLRTPLAALRVRIESVEDETDRARMVDTVTEMSRTLDDILSLARLGRPSEPATEVDLAALVDAVVEDFRDLDQDVSFAEADRLPLRLRPSLMRRAVRNLVENALKYGGSARVRIDAAADRVAIVVSDDGPGIPPEHLRAVFEPFTRLELSRNRETGGIGLGLALARAIVMEAGGDILLVNRQEGGLDATIALPRRGGSATA